MSFVSGSGVHLVKQQAHVVWFRALLCNWDHPVWIWSCVYAHGCYCVKRLCVCVCMFVCVRTPGCLQRRGSVWRWKGRAGLASINQARLQSQRGLQLPSTTQPPLLYITRHTHTHTHHTINTVCFARHCPRPSMLSTVGILMLPSTTRSILAYLQLVIKLTYLCQSHIWFWLKNISDNCQAVFFSLTE